MTRAIRRPGTKQSQHKSQNKNKKTDLWQQLTGQQLVLTTRGGVIIEGSVVSFRGGFVELRNVKITGKQYQCTAQWVMVDRGCIAHFHPPGELAPINSQMLGV